MFCEFRFWRKGLWINFIDGDFEEGRMRFWVVNFRFMGRGEGVVNVVIL